MMSQSILQLKSARCGEGLQAPGGPGSRVQGVQAPGGPGPRGGPGSRGSRLQVVRTPLVVQARGGGPDPLGGLHLLQERGSLSSSSSSSSCSRASSLSGSSWNYGADGKHEARVTDCSYQPGLRGTSHCHVV